MQVPIWAKWISGVGGAILVSWHLLDRADEAFLKHLNESFATKADVIQIQQDVRKMQDKLDQVLFELDRDSQNQRKR